MATDNEFDGEKNLTESRAEPDQTQVLDDLTVLTDGAGPLQGDEAEIFASDTPEIEDESLLGTVHQGGEVLEELAAPRFSSEGAPEPEDAPIIAESGAGRGILDRMAGVIKGLGGSEPAGGQEPAAGMPVTAPDGTGSVSADTASTAVETAFTTGLGAALESIISRAVEVTGADIGDEEVPVDVAVAAEIAHAQEEAVLEPIVEEPVSEVPPTDVGGGPSDVVGPPEMSEPSEVSEASAPSQPSQPSAPSEAHILDGDRDADVIDGHAEGDRHIGGKEAQVLDGGGGNEFLGEGQGDQGHRDRPDASSGSAHDNLGYDVIRLAATEGEDSPFVWQERGEVGTWISGQEDRGAEERADWTDHAERGEGKEGEDKEHVDHGKGSEHGAGKSEVGEETAFNDWEGIEW